jgi:hypothetical protein
VAASSRVSSIAAVIVATVLSCTSPSLGVTQPAERPSSDSSNAITQSKGSRQESKAATEQGLSAVVKKEAQAAGIQTTPHDENLEINRYLAEYTRQLAVFTRWLVVVTVCLALIALVQISASVYISVQQLRAYVVVATGDIVNVANPPLPAAGQPVPQKTLAEISNPAVGPIAILTTKNSGQTTAYDVRTWAVIVVREFPLAEPLPGRAAGIYDASSVLGPGLVSTQNRWMPAPLTAQELAGLRAGTSAIYVYGEILYRDFFGRSRFTRFRSMHHSMNGIIGISMLLTFCDQGNDAN